MKPSVFLFGWPLAEYATLAKQADDLDYESVWVADHLAAPIEFAPTYPYRESGKPSFVADTPFADPFVLHAQLAAVTKKVHLGIGVLVLPLRNPFVVAKAAATTQELSGGRLQLGVGVGWMKEEFDAVGEAFQGRAGRMEEMIEVMKKLWSGQAVEHAGAHYRFAPLQMSPGVSTLVPILVGGSSEPALKRAARIADGWCGPPCTLADNIAHRTVLDRELALAGRDRMAFKLWVRNSEPTTRELVVRYRDLGFRHLIVALPMTIDSAAGRSDWLAQVAEWTRS
jgi:probable F420-dependent oxidoreductase